MKASFVDILERKPVEHTFTDVDGSFQFTIKYHPYDVGETIRKVIGFCDWANSISCENNLTIRQMRDLDKEIKKKFDWLLGEGNSNEIFSVARPLERTANGELYFKEITVIILNIITKDVSEYVDDMENIMGKSERKFV